MNVAFYPFFSPVFNFFSAIPNPSTVIQPETATFTCIAMGLPAPDFQWFRRDGMNSSLLSNSTKYRISDATLDMMTTSILNINEINPSDTGMYTCEASNVVGMGLRTLSLQVNGEKMSQTISPWIEYE